MSHYPGTWRHAFDPRHSRQRQKLRTTRAKLRQAEQNVTTEQGTARAPATDAAHEHQARARKAELRLAALRRPQPRSTP
ncbi:hypothetical protein [Kitasatospora sp. NPDC091207]|uniref:hypothetical protein n=1 Tax=Kitasatospora sp. NPDC091207 TaxID=3364083 RepID=UPI00380FAE10